MNYSLHDNYVWQHVEFFVEPDADLEMVETLALCATEESEHFGQYEPAQFWVMKMDKDAICCWVAGWTDSPAGAWSLSHDIRRALAFKLKAAGIHYQLQRFDANVFQSK